jgi:predicted nucleic acid-binding protein
VYLVDTNVWLERLLDQTKAEQVGQFLSRTPSDQLFISDFAFHSIGVILGRLERTDILLLFARDTFVDGAVSLVHLEPEDTPQLVQAMTQFSLDFDDAYQYVIAEKYDLTLVSLDGDFDHTERGRRAPQEID